MAPLFDFSMGTKVIRCLKELEESQWWPRYKVLELQDQRLQHLLKHAYDNVPYYRRIFEERNLKPCDIGCSADLIKLPVLTKQLVRENFCSLVAKDVSPGKIRKKFTSGSTGEPFMFYIERKEDITRSYASSQRAYEWSGYQIGDKTVFVGQRKEYYSILEKAKEAAKDYFERIKLFAVQDISAREIPLIARGIQDFQPEFIRGYPSAIYLLAKFIEKEGTRKLRLKGITTIAEKVEDYQRDLFRKVFSCETYSLYSATEAPNIASECSSHCGYHITAENIIVEIVDNQNAPVPIGESGRILVTNLFNHTMPFLRYDIGDIGALSDHVCACGRGLPILMKLDGRISDFIITQDGMTIPGLSINQYFLDRMEGVVQWQIVQESYELLIFKLVLDRQYPPISPDRLISEIRDNYKPVLGNMMISVEFVDHIPLTVTGKRKSIISKILFPPAIHK